MKKKTSKLAEAGLLTALAASLCCITPVLALFSGVTGMASTFSWLEPLRPYLMGLSIFVLGFAWYQKLKPEKEAGECECGSCEKPSFWQGKTFLAIVTVFAIAAMTFPAYSHIFYPQASKEVVLIPADRVQETVFQVSGMTCAACEEHIKHAVNRLPGIISVSASAEKGIAKVKFDQNQIDRTDIIEAIDQTGYRVTGKNQNNQ